MLPVDIEQVRKYNVPGPRYTSYPPAVHFKSAFSSDFILGRLNRDLLRSDSNARDISLYFHLPFCRSLCWYCGCNTVITKNQSQSATYLRYLAKELAILAPAIHPNRRVTQIHLGGGTPTFLLPDEIRQMREMVRAHFTIAPDAESGVEIDPRTITREHVAALRDAGHNRVSIGVQDFNATVQTAINRIQPFEQTRQVVEWAREGGFDSVSIDLIYGLPFQTAASFEETLRLVLELDPDRLALFSYAHVPWIKPAQRIFRPESLPDAETKFAILKLSVETLTAHGYAYIGMDHFAKRGDELDNAQKNGRLQRNFQGYSTRAGADIHGLGVSSISQTPELYWQNEKDLARYYQRLDAGELPVAIGHEVSADERIRREAIMRLMCDMRLDFSAMSSALGIDFETYFAGEIAAVHALEPDGLVSISAAGFEVTDPGRLLIRIVAMCFDNCVSTKREGVYSRTI
jgi:oxygen-independent coproporphyrinogen-3 oxidase